MKPFIRLTRHPYEEPYLINLTVEASNGRTTGEVEMYTDPGDLSRVARTLRQFPGAERDVVVWELRSERAEGRFAYHFRMRVFQQFAPGDCAIELRLCNNGIAPYREEAEFSIAAVPSDLDRLAELLEGFAALEHTVLEWRRAAVLMRRWQHRSVYWRFQIVMGGWALTFIALLAARPQGQWVLVVFPIVIIVGTLAATLRCPMCREWVMLSNVPVFPVRRRTPKVCPRCGWPTRKARQEPERKP
jgi:hypothetical protein